MKIHGTTACWPGRSWWSATAGLANRPYEAKFDLSLDHVQLCPQNSGVLSYEAALDLKAAFPNTKFRLHANVRVGRDLEGAGCANDLEFSQERLVVLGMRSADLGHPDYSLHAGARIDDGDMDRVRANVAKLEDQMECRVAVEGHYPEGKRRWFIDCWDEYRRLMQSGLCYALDMSHLKIVARAEGWDMPLVQDLLSCPACIEIHISDNDGRRDEHKVITDEPKWWRLMPYANPDAVIFTEGRHDKYHV